MTKNVWLYFWRSNPIRSFISHEPICFWLCAYFYVYLRRTTSSFFWSQLYKSVLFISFTDQFRAKIYHLPNTADRDKSKSYWEQKIISNIIILFQISSICSCLPSLMKRQVNEDEIIYTHVKILLCQRISVYSRILFLMYNAWLTKRLMNVVIFVVNYVYRYLFWVVFKTHLTWLRGPRKTESGIWPSVYLQSFAHRITYAWRDKFQSTLQICN